MITGELRNKVDKLWEEFWTGGITNPLTVIEQISFLMFARNLDYRESLNERKARRSKDPDSIKLMFKGPDDQRRWKNLLNITDNRELLRVVRDEVFPHFKKIGNNGSTYSEYMADAQLMIQKPSLLQKAISMINGLPLEHSDTKGDLYEYLLSKLTTAGINGQFRTPRHIIDMMVELVDPAKTDLIADPACGTGGFLVRSFEYLRQKYTSKKGIVEDDFGNMVHTADLLSPEERRFIHNKMFTGFDFDVTMLRIASMNIILHGLENPKIHYCDSLSKRMPEHFPKLAFDHFDVVLANPPFKGSLDYEDVDNSLLGKVKTKKTELLFLTLMIRMLKLGGRCAVVVPDGVLFGSSRAHKDLRKMLVENNQLEAVVSLPPGVFKPYAGVSTAVLVFTKGDEESEGQTENVFFYDVQADGKTLDDKRQKIGAADDWQDVDDAKRQWEKWDHGKKSALKHFEDRKQKAFFVTREEISEQDYYLSIGRYKEHVYEESQYDPPKTILKRLAKLETEIQADIKELEGMLG